MVAKCDDVHAGGEQLVGDLGRDPEPAGHVLAVDDDERRLVALAQRGSRPRSVRRPRPPTRSPTKRMVAGASGTGHTLAHRGDERTDGKRDLPAPRRPPPMTRPGARAARRRSALAPARRGPLRRPRPLRGRPGGGARPAAVPHRGDHRADPQSAGSTVQRARGSPAGCVILVVYAGFFATLALVGTLLANPIAEQFRRSATTCRRSSARRTGASTTCRTTSTARTSTSRSRRRARPRSRRCRSASSAAPTRSSLRHGPRHPARDGGFGVILVFVLSVYMLIYGERIGDLARSVMPPGDGSKDDDFPTRVSRAVAGYVRGPNPPRRASRRRPRSDAGPRGTRCARARACPGRRCG